MLASSTRGRWHAHRISSCGTLLSPGWGWSLRRRPPIKDSSYSRTAIRPQAVAPDMAADLMNCTFDELGEAIHDLEEAVKAKDARARSVIRWMDPLLSGIEHHSEAVGAFSQTQSLVLTLI